MEFWNNNIIEYFRIEDSEIYHTKVLAPDYLQEKELTYSNLKKIRLEWAKVFPKLENLEYLYLGHRINQEYFEAVCQIPNLKGLWVKTSQIINFSSIQKLKKLEQLNFGGSLGIDSLNGIENLTNLKYCVLNNFLGLESISELSHLQSLRKLHLFAGIHGKKLNLKSIEPLSDLIKIKELALDIKTDIDIRPLLKLKELELLIIPHYYHSKIKNELPKRTELR